MARESSLSPREVLDEACRAIEKAKFTGKADQVMVPQMLAEFEWVFRSTFERALEDHAASGATIRREQQQAVLARLSEREGANGRLRSRALLVTAAVKLFRRDGRPLVAVRDSRGATGRIGRGAIRGRVTGAVRGCPAGMWLCLLSQAPPVRLLLCVCRASALK